MCTSTRSGKSTTTECFSDSAMCNSACAFPGTGSSKGSMKSLEFDLYIVGSRLGRNMPAWDLVRTTWMLSCDCLRDRLHLPSRGLDISVNDILRCRDGRGYLRLRDTVSTQVVCLRDLSLLILDALRFSGDDDPSVGIPTVAPFSAIVPVRTAIELKSNAMELQKSQPFPTGW